MNFTLSMSKLWLWSSGIPGLVSPSWYASFSIFGCQFTCCHHKDLHTALQWLFCHIPYTSFHIQGTARVGAWITIFAPVTMWTCMQLLLDVLPDSIKVCGLLDVFIMLPHVLCTSTLHNQLNTCSLFASMFSRVVTSLNIWSVMSLSFNHL